MTKPAIYLEKDGSIGWLVLNQPAKRNALSKAMWEAIPGLLDEALQDGAIRSVVIRGVDAAAFAAGADISEFESTHADLAKSKAYNRAVHAASRRLMRFEKPVIAMVQGPCVGGGCGIALAADMRLADASAKFAIPPAKLGLVYNLQDTKLLVDAVGPSKAKDILFTGRTFGAEEALRIGMIDRLVTPEKLDETVAAYAAQLGENSQFSVRAGKRMIQTVLDGVSDETPETRRIFVNAFAGPDFKEGQAAFMGKRAPKFTS